MMPENIERALGNVEGQMKLVVTRLDSLILSLALRDETVDKKIADCHSRISNLDKKVYWLMGASAVVTWMVGHVPAILGGLVTIANAMN